MEEQKLEEEKAYNGDMNHPFQLHVAEYQMLTNRVTYLIAIAYGLWTLFAVLLTILFSLWNSFKDHHFLLVWCAATILQVVIFLTNFITTEIYDIALYLETELRGMLDKVIGKNDYWRYEKSLARTNTDLLSKIKEVLIPAASLPILILITIFRIPQFSKWDAIMLVINFTICFYNIVVASKLKKKRLIFSA